MRDGLRRGCNFATGSLFSSSRLQLWRKYLCLRNLFPHVLDTFASRPHYLHNAFCKLKSTLFLIIMNACNDISSFHVQILRFIATEMLKLDLPTIWNERIKNVKHCRVLVPNRALFIGSLFFSFFLLQNAVLTLYLNST